MKLLSLVFVFELLIAPLCLNLDFWVRFGPLSSNALDERTSQAAEVAERSSKRDTKSAARLQEERQLSPQKPRSGNRLNARRAILESIFATEERAFDKQPELRSAQKSYHHVTRAERLREAKELIARKLEHDANDDDILSSSSGRSTSKRLSSRKQTRRLRPVLGSFIYDTYVFKTADWCRKECARQILCSSFYYIVNNGVCALHHDIT